MVFVRMILAFAAALTAATSAQAGAILSFASGNTQPPAGLQNDPNYPSNPPGTNIDPFTLIGLSDYSLGTRVGTTSGNTLGTSGNPIAMNVGDHFILQIQMVDTAPTTFQGPA